MEELKLEKISLLRQSELRQQRAKLPKNPSGGFRPAVLQPQDRRLLIMKHLRG